MQGPEKNNTRIADLYCATKSKRFKTVFQWTIHNFTLMGNVESPMFSSNGCDKIKWCLTACPNWNSSMKHMSLYITLLSSDDVQGSFGFLLLEQNKKVLIKSSEYVVFRKQSRLGYEEFISHDALLRRVPLSRRYYNQSQPDYLLDNKLTIVCEINVLMDITTRVEKVAELNNDDISMIKVPECKLIDDFSNLLEKELLCDVILAVGEYEYKAHKAILATRSPVFAAMFEHKMVERTHNRVVITDVKPSVLKEMLHFIYTGKSPNIKGMTQELLAAADKYALEKLKALCEKDLFEDLSIDNAAEILAFADHNSASQLKTETLHFINRNRSGVINSVGWKHLFESNLHLVHEVLTSINLN